jgi:energy-coupling factor transporter transmembrane protein EcfT
VLSWAGDGGINMVKKIVESPWTLPIFIVVVITIVVFGRASPIQFKADILTQVMPSLLAGLVAIATIMERAMATLNNIWFGEQREQLEEQVRQKSIQLEAARAQLQSAWQAHTMLTQEAVRSGNQVSIERAFAAAGPAGSASLEEKTTKLSQALQQATNDLAVVTAQQARARLIFAYAVALVVSAVGVTTLSSMLDVSGLSNQQRAVFRAVDVLLTAGVLSGGTAGISAISELLRTYVNTSRIRALERR